MIINSIAVLFWKSVGFTLVSRWHILPARLRRSPSQHTADSLHNTAIWSWGRKRPCAQSISLQTAQQRRLVWWGATKEAGPAVCEETLVLRFFWLTWAGSARTLWDTIYLYHHVCSLLYMWMTPVWSPLFIYWPVLLGARCGQGNWFGHIN